MVSRAPTLAARLSDDDRLRRNTENVKAFYDLMFNESRPADAIARYAGATHTQHNPHAGDGKVVEHWDVLQVVPEPSANDNGMF